MQRVAHCLYKRGGQVLLIQKPRRGWWTCPGGKMEPRETVLGTVMREFEEETGLRLVRPKLRGVFTIIHETAGLQGEEWMLYTFMADEARGELRTHSEEGVLQWHPLSAIRHLPMPEGDRLFMERLLLENSGEPEVLFGQFIYDEEFRLLRYHIEEEEGLRFTSV